MSMYFISYGIWIYKFRKNKSLTDIDNANFYVY